MLGWNKWNGTNEKRFELCQRNEQKWDETSHIYRQEHIVMFVTQEASACLIFFSVWHSFASLLKDALHSNFILKILLSMKPSSIKRVINTISLRSWLKCIELNYTTLLPYTSLPNPMVFGTGVRGHHLSTKYGVHNKGCAEDTSDITTIAISKILKDLHGRVWWQVKSSHDRSCHKVTFNLIIWYHEALSKNEPPLQILE